MTYDYNKQHSQCKASKDDLVTTMVEGGGESV